jgi:hypothetical protein
MIAVAVAVAILFPSFCYGQFCVGIVLALCTQLVAQQQQCQRLKNELSDEYSPLKKTLDNENTARPVTPECFNRGSSQNSACGEHRRTTAKNMRE